MLESKGTFEVSRENSGNCDSRIWSGDCKHTAYQYIGDKYLCDVCGTIPGLDHEVHRAAMPYVSGEYKVLS